MASYLKNEGYVAPKDRYSTYFYQKVTRVDFPSPRKKPTPLNTTGASLQMQINTTATDEKGNYIYLQSRTKLIVDGSPSDIGLMNKALANMANQNFNLFVFLGELNETLGMLSRAADAAWRAIQNFRKGRLLEGIKELLKDRDIPLSRRNHAKLKEAQRRNPENAYLEATFGWSPFFADIRNAIALSEKRFVEGQRMTSTSSTNPTYITDRRNQRAEMYDGEGNAPPGWKSESRISISGTVSSPKTVLINSLGGNIFQSGWELIPYSFVVDYFIDIGSFLGALSGTAGFSQVFGSKITKSVTTSYRYEREQSRSMTLLRTSIVTVTPRFPAMNLAGISQRQTVNMAALLLQRIRA